jgi:hypothetical protein
MCRISTEDLRTKSHNLKKQQMLPKDVKKTISKGAANYEKFLVRKIVRPIFFRRENFHFGGFCEP